MTEELPDTIHQDIVRLSERGNDLAEGGHTAEAVQCFEQALSLLPAPVERWSAATWLFSALGDIHFLSGSYCKALQTLLDAMRCHEGIGNPFLHLRLGQVQLELGNEILAADELARAYMGGGKYIFEGEDKKYFHAVQSSLSEPPEGW